MKGKNIIQLFREEAMKEAPDIVNKIQFLSAEAQMKMFDIHARAIGCFCECLGMNAENAIAACGNSSPPYKDGHYFEVMQKWGLLNVKGETTI